MNLDLQVSPQLHGYICFSPACRCELEPTVADAGTVLYGAERVVCLRLCNIGQVGAQRRIVLPGVL